MPRAAGGATPDAARAPREAGSGAPPIPASHPALVIAALAVAALVAVLVTFPISDPDLWQHLTVGRTIWQTHSIPRTHLWSWPTFGVPEVLPSWLYRALLWPVWEGFGVAGLFAWRWLTTLTTFALGWMAARTLGARGVSPLVVVTLGAMVYRARSQVRPETLVAPLFALAILCLVWRRNGGRLRLAGHSLDPAWALVPIAWAWANVHISYWMVFLLAGLAWLDRFFGREPRAAGTPAPSARTLFIATTVALFAAFANPFGWRTLWQPFEYFLFWRNEPIYKTIGELSPVDWAVNFKNGLPLLVAAWPILAIVRLMRGRRDLIELGLVATLLPLTLTGQRFMGFLAVASVPFLGRALGEMAEGFRPRLAAPWPRAGAALVAVALLAAPILGDFRHWFGFGLDLRRYPVAACDFIERHQLRGRIFNAFFHGGYLLWRFFPDRERLPFMDIHQSGTRFDRDALAYAPGDEPSWLELTRRRDPEILLWPRYAQTDMPLLERRDLDSTWALVFVDDAAALYVRRLPRFESLIREHGYTLLPAGAARLAALQPAAVNDPALRIRMEVELRRAIGESKASSRALYLLASLAGLEGKLDEAERGFRAALAADPDIRRVHEGLGAIAAVRGRHAEAVREFLAEGAEGSWPSGVRARLGNSYAALGRIAEARAAYEAELRADPGNAAARDSLAALGARGR